MGVMLVEGEVQCIEEAARWTHTQGKPFQPKISSKISREEGKERLRRGMKFSLIAGDGWNDQLRG